MCKVNGCVCVLVSLLLVSALPAMGYVPVTLKVKGYHNSCIMVTHIQPVASNLPTKRNGLYTKLLQFMQLYMCMGCLCMCQLEYSKS